MGEAKSPIYTWTSQVTVYDLDGNWLESFEDIGSLAPDEETLRARHQQYIDIGYFGKAKAVTSSIVRGPIFSADPSIIQETPER